MTWVPFKGTPPHEIGSKWPEIRKSVDGTYLQINGSSHIKVCGGFTKMTNSNTQPNTCPDIYRKEVYQQWSNHSTRPPASAPNPLDSDSLKTLVHATASLPAPSRTSMTTTL